MEIEGYTAAANDRFANDPAFIARAFNLSGVSRASNGAWVTMISPKVFISCNHFAPAEGNTVTFYATNHPDGPSVTRTIAGPRQRIGDTDIFLGTLDEALPEGYAFYAPATENVTDSTGWTNTYRNTVLYHVGLSPGASSGALDIAVGRNVPDRWLGPHKINTSTTWAFGAVCDRAGTANHQTHETKVTGDSGAPVFLDVGNNRFRLLGITWGTGTSRDGSITSLFSYLGNYTKEIEAFLRPPRSP